MEMETKSGKIVFVDDYAVGVFWFVGDAIRYRSFAPGYMEPGKTGLSSTIEDARIELARLHKSYMDKIAGA